jgi:chromosome segregation ATPase
MSSRATRGKKGADVQQEQKKDQELVRFGGVDAPPWDENNPGATGPFRRPGGPGGFGDLTGYPREDDESRQRTLVDDSTDSATSNAATPRKPRSRSKLSSRDSSSGSGDSSNIATIKSDITNVTDKTNTLIEKLNAAKEQLSTLQDENAEINRVNEELKVSSAALQEQTESLGNHTSELELQLTAAKNELQQTTVKLNASEEAIAKHELTVTGVESQINDYERELREILGKTTHLRQLFESETIDKFIGGRSNRRSQRRNRRKTNQTNQSRKQQMKSLRQIRSLRRKY